MNKGAKLYSPDVIQQTVSTTHGAEFETEKEIEKTIINHRALGSGHRAKADIIGDPISKVQGFTNCILVHTEPTQCDQCCALKI